MIGLGGLSFIKNNFEFGLELFLDRANVVGGVVVFN